MDLRTHLLILMDDLIGDASDPGDTYGKGAF